MEITPMEATKADPNDGVWKSFFARALVLAVIFLTPFSAFAANYGSGLYGANNYNTGDTTPPTVSLTAPSGGSTVSGAGVSVTANASDNVSVAGVQFKLDTNTNIGAEDTTSTYGVTWDSTAVADGTHTIIAVARDGSGNYATSSVMTITVDNTAPVRSLGSPSGALAVGTAGATLSLSTDEAATCKYSTSVGTAYGSMTVFTTTGGTNHSEAISGLSDGSSYIYYVKCRDGQGNTNASDYSISFSVSVDTTPPVIASSGGGGGGMIVGSGPLAFGYVNTNPTAATSPNISPSTSIASGSTSQTTTAVFTRDLERGRTGNDVRELQKFLNTHGFVISQSGPGSAGQETTMFGPATQGTLAKFQKANGISPASGYFGPKTKVLVANMSEVQPKLRAPSSTVISFTRSLKFGMRGEDVRQLQVYLNTHGFPVASSGIGSPGQESDYFGPATQGALATFQRANGITTDTGYFGPRTRVLIAQ